MKIVINNCYGGFGLSDKAYERLIELGIPVVKYINEPRGEDGLYQKVPENEDRVIFDRELTPKGEDEMNDFYYRAKENDTKGFKDRYWETWIDRDYRNDPMIIQVVEELGEKANGMCASLKIVEIPDDVEWEIQEYDGNEWIAEKHETWS